MKFKVETYTKEFTKKSNNHLYIAPPEALKRVVAHYTITFTNPDVEIPQNSVLHLIPDVSGCFVFHFFDDVSITVWGPTTKVVTVDNDLSHAPCRFFVEFLPAGLYQILGMDMKNIQDKRVRLQDVNPTLFQEIYQALHEMTSFDEMVDFMNEILLREMKKHTVEDNVLDCIETIYREHELVNGKGVASALKMSERQLSRYFNRYVGMGIKKYSKIANVNHLLQHLSKQELMDISFDYDYFDQAHFNHVFKEICETTPTHYLKNLSDFYNELYKF